MTRLTRVVLASVGIFTTTALVAAVVALPSMTTSTSQKPLQPAASALAPASANVGGTAGTLESAARGSVAAASVSTPSPAVHSVFVSVTSASRSAADDTNRGMDENAARQLIASMNDYWSKESGGLVSIVFGGYETKTLNYTRCDAATVFANAPTSAFAGRFKNSAWTGSFEHLLLLTTEECQSAGLGSVGGDGGIMLSGNGVAGGVAVPVATHEFGHNLGFGHAGSSVCASAAQDGPVETFGGDTSACPTIEYADYLDIMGFSYAGAMPHLSSPQRVRSGWMSDYTSITSSPVSTSSVVTPLDGSAGNRALRITDPISGANYYVEYRTATGADASSTEFTQTETCFTTAGYSDCSRGTSASQGALRILKELPYRDYTQYVRTTVIAAGSTASGDTFRSTRFSVGDTFTSAGGGFYLSVDALNPAVGATVTVRFTPPVATTAQLALSSRTQTHAATAALATVTVSGGASGTVELTAGKKVIGTSTLVDGRADFRLPRTMKAGKYRLSATFTPTSGEWLASQTGATTLTVKKASSRASITTVKKSKIKKSKRVVRATVKITVAGVKTPRGKVTVYANGKKIKTYSLSAKQRGILNISLTVKAKLAGKLTAKYSGTADVAAKTSAARRY